MALPLARLASPAMKETATQVAREVDVRASRRPSTEGLAAEEFEALAAAATPLATPQKDTTSSKNNHLTKSASKLTPWGYPLLDEASGKSAASEKSSGGASWTTIRAGLLSPPPLISTLMSAEDEEAAVEEEEDEEEEAFATGGQPPAVAGRGGWLVDLVEGIELWSVSQQQQQQQQQQQSPLQPEPANVQA